MIGRNNGDNLSNNHHVDDATQVAQVAKVRQYAKKYQENLIKDNNNLTDYGGEDNNTIISNFKLLFKLSQPAHMITLVTVIYLGFVLFPKNHVRPSEPGTLSSLLYVGSFAAHFGAQMWMTFVSGIVLFFSIPRNIFGQVQRILFPKYFLLNTVLALATLTTFVQQYPSSSWTIQQKTQVWALAMCFIIELSTRLYIVPPLLETLSNRMLIEQEAGVGSEIGTHKPGQLKQCPHYMQLHSKFRKLHGACALANMAAVACNGIHLYHLATKICTL